MLEAMLHDYPESITGLLDRFDEARTIRNIPRMLDFSLHPSIKQGMPTWEFVKIVRRK